MSTYRYVASDLVTGVIRADSLPLHVDSFSRNLGQIGSPGTLTGTIDLGKAGDTLQSALLGALEPRRTMLWALQDDYPVWAGVLWDWTHQSAAANQLPIRAAELGSLFSKRQVRTDQNYVGMDQYTVIRSLYSYALAKTSGGVAQLVQTTNLSGTAVSILFPGANLGKITDLVNQFCTQNNIEYAFDPGLNSVGQLQITLRIGVAATMGRPYSSTGFQLSYPGNLADYSWPRTGSNGVNALIACSSGGAGAAWVSNPTGHGYDTADLAAGYPLLEDSTQYTGSPITLQSQIDGYADWAQQKLAKSPTVPTVTIAGGQYPTVQQILLGDHAGLVATSSLHPSPDGGVTPGLTQDVRIIGWTVNPPSDQQAETTALVLGGVSS